MATFSVVALVNHSARVTDADLAKIAAAISAQVAHDFAPAWGLAATPVVAVPAGRSVPGAAHLAVIDKPDLAGALGYHTDDGGTYDGFVFVDPVLDNGGTVLGNPSDPSAPCVASVASHEVLELLADPTCNFWADCGGERRAPDGTTFSEVALEVCDPCEGDGYVVHVPAPHAAVPAAVTTPPPHPPAPPPHQPVPPPHAPVPPTTPVVVSNFVLRAFFDPLAPAGTKRDWLGKLHGAFDMDAGGYMAVRDGADGGTQVFGEEMPEWTRDLKRAGSARQARRRSVPAATAAQP